MSALFCGSKEHSRKLKKMSERKNDKRMAEQNPILNNPYEEPQLHYDTDIDNNLDYNKVLEGRRPFSTKIGINPQERRQPQFFSGSDFYDSDDPDAKFINTIRDEVKKWRNDGYQRATRVTRELLNFWFNNPERQNYHKLFFCQREAIETAVYLNEIADFDPNVGRNILRQLDERLNTISDNPDDILPRTAFKMATGTGKTVVMAMIILYNYFNKKEYHGDTRFADHFLLVTPGITIKDRLGVLYVDDKKNQWDCNDYYNQRNLIPQNYRHLIGGLNEMITITNYHVFEPKVLQGKKSSPMDGKMVYNGETHQMEKQSDKEDFSNVLSRVLGRNMKGKRIIVINDEAHHCYLPKGREKATENSDEDENLKAMVWYEGLRQMKNLGYKIQHVYDLSATPYYLKGSGHEAYTLFPWVVSDFGLVDAIESGLVKIPFLPSYDDSAELNEPVLRNIYEHIKDKLPKKGQKSQRKADREAAEKAGKNATAQPEKAPNLPALLTMALDQFRKDYEDYENGIRMNGEETQNLFTTPPVFIVVCNNTTVSKEVYKYIAGYESQDADGKQIFIDGKFPIFSNYTNGLPKEKLPTLLIDSEAINDASGTINDEFKKVFKDEIAAFKREYAVLHGAGSADKLTDGDILREVVNSVGKRNALGSHIRCVVSVAMLTEGWDANTVTHVCGVRAFGSQLLCEQVAGRALRRMSYELRKYDAKTGEELPENSKQTKDVVYKFPPEYAHIIGVPFKTFKGGKTPSPQTQQPKTIIKALPERSDMEIVFPNIDGYRSENIDGLTTADYTNLPKFRLNFNQIPLKTTLGTAVGEEKVVMKSDYRSLRDNEVIYELTRRLIHNKFTDNAGGRQFQKFAALKRIVKQWYDTQIEILGGDGSTELRRLVVFWNEDETNANIYEGIKQANSGKEKITAILNHYNPEGSTTYVYGLTSKPVYPTTKSHVNYVVADTESWEQRMAKILEETDSVTCYVKNHFLDFKIPYMAGTEEHDYMPDFIAKVTTKEGETVNLIIEISGFSNDLYGNKDEKRHYTEKYWIPAANNLKEFGCWDFIEITDIDNAKALLTSKINSL